MYTIQYAIVNIHYKLYSMHSVKSCAMYLIAASSKL